MIHEVSSKVHVCTSSHVNVPWETINFPREHLEARRPLRVIVEVDMYHIRSGGGLPLKGVRGTYDSIKTRVSVKKFFTLHGDFPRE